jgi:beta-lactamase class A
MKHMTRANVALLSTGIFLIIFNVGWAMHNAHAAKSTSSQNQADTYPLLSKRIFVNNPNDMLLNFVPLRQSLESKFSALTVQKSFYFEYLPTGISIHIGQDNELIAASLIKVPLTMNLYKAAELGKVDLDTPVTITSSELDNGYGNLWQKGAGTQITLRQAAKLALSQSDDTAAHAIFDNTQGLLTPSQESLNQLDVSQNMQDGEAVIDAMSYSSILKSLFFSSYLQPKDSQELLGYLSNSDDRSRITAGLPHNVTVARKIGVYNATWSESDCGIVYVPERPYIFCAMVGLPEDQANQFIAGISKQVYDFVTSQN